MVISVRLRAPYGMKQVFGRGNSPQRPLPLQARCMPAKARGRCAAGVWFATGEEIVRHWLQSGAIF
jgi:hypothetical protein